MSKASENKPDSGLCIDLKGQFSIFSFPPNLAFLIFCMYVTNFHCPSVFLV